MGAVLCRADVLPEPALPETAALLAEGRALAVEVRPHRAAFQRHYEVGSEHEYKRRRAAEATVMLHTTIGYRDFDRTVRACAEIWESLDRRGYRIDRFGAIFDQAMGYPAAERKGRLRGAGLIVDDLSRLGELTEAAPVAIHFGDFILGFPAALENTVAAVAAGGTTVGNLGQYWCYRLIDWDDDVHVTAETVKAIAFIAAQREPVIVHSNLNDGWGALFSDLACTFGAVLLERHIVEDLLGAKLGHCFGHTFSDPHTRLAFQRAVQSVGAGPGTMIYGNTTGYRLDGDANYAVLGSYLLVDMVGQRTRPSGHAVNPVPVTEADRIPDTDEIVAVHLFANRLLERAPGFEALFDFDAVDLTAARLVEGGKRFRDAVLSALAEGGVDTGDPFELLLALRRIGARRLERLFGPGAEDEKALRGRRPSVRSPVLDDIERGVARVMDTLDESTRAAVRARSLTACVASTDVHEYGKVMVEQVFAELGVTVSDAGTDAEPRRLAEAALAGGADFIALGTYNGVALGYVQQLRAAMLALGLDIPVYVGGRVNEVPEGSNTSLPVDVSARVREVGVLPCERIEDMLRLLAEPPAEPPGRAAVGG